MMQERLIGHVQHDSGPLVLAFGAVHGNEPAGVEALRTVFKMLESSRQSGSENRFSGNFYGIIGNMNAFSNKQRFIERDLNRQWMPAHVQRIRHTQETDLCPEDQEMRHLIDLIHHLVRQHDPETLILLDLHTTSADGGVFCIPTDDMASLRLAKAIEAPVILGLLDGIEGTLLQYGAANHFQISGYPKQTLGVAFESGQHEDPASIQRSAAAILQVLRACGCLNDDTSLGQQYIDILHAYSARLPRVTRLVTAHHIRPGDQFRMRPGYSNFQPVYQGEHLADDITGPILAAQDALILMPLYQPKGSDGFFLVEEIKA
jgi:succinylglutamate desuccinylase